MFSRYTAIALAAWFLSIATPLTFAHARNEAVTQDNFNHQQKAEIETIIHDYIIKNPTIVQKAIIALNRQHDLEQRGLRKRTLLNEKDRVFNNPNDFVAGNQAGDVTLVIFFDYNCIYCRKALPHMDDLLKSDPDLRIVMKEFPILSPASKVIAKLAMASIKQGKYLAYHRALLSVRGALNEKRALKIAQNIGLDSARLKRDAKSESIENTLNETMKLSAMLAINGTPTYILGDKLFEGAIGTDKLKDEIASLRKIKNARTGETRTGETRTGEN